MNRNHQYNPNIHHRKSIRLKGYDYAQEGLYFITLCCNRRSNGIWISANTADKWHASYFKNNIYSPFGYVENGKMILNEIGQIAHNEWMKTTEIRNNVELGEFIVMPDHFHGIIKILRRGELHSPSFNSNELNSNELNSKINNSNEMDSSSDNSNEMGFSLNNSNEMNTSSNNSNEMNSSSNNSNELNSSLNNSTELHSSLNNSTELHSDELLGEFNSPRRSPSQTIGAIIRGYKSSVTKQLNNLGLSNMNEPLWQRNYYEHIIREEEAYDRITQYIKNNPAKWGIEKQKRK
jgi:REP element-mobilizing transposase RayT